VANPMIAVRNEAWRRLRSALSEIGLTPAAFSKLGLVEAKRQNSLASLRERTQEHT
jgi:P27 family predicted phage terminase small subunit